MKNLRILLPPGIGDIHWCLLKLEDFLKKEDAQAQAWILNSDGRPRAKEFLDRIPFVKSEGYFTPEEPHDKLVTDDKDFRACYKTGEADVVPGWRGFDYLFCFDGSVSHGKPMGSILPDTAINWNYPVLETKKDAAFGDYFKAANGKYVLFGLSDFSIFRFWAEILGKSFWSTFFGKFRERFPHLSCVLTGSVWDMPFAREVRDYGMDLVGKTQIGHFLSLVRRASAFVGFIGGNSIISTHLGCPTVAIWNKVIYKEPAFRYNWVEPSRAKSTYFALEVEDCDPDALLHTMELAMENGKTL